MSDFKKFLHGRPIAFLTIAYDHLRQIKPFLNWIDEGELSRNSIRVYLDTLKEKAAQTSSNALKAFRRFFRDFLEQGELVATFKLPCQEFRPKRVPNGEELKRFYAVLELPRDRALFLLYATSGLRRDEVLSLKHQDVNLEQRMVIPSMGSTTTKRRWVAFFNREAAEALKDYLNGYELKSEPRLFSIGPQQVDRIFM